MAEASHSDTIHNLLGTDPICSGRVTSSTVAHIAALVEAMEQRAFDAENLLSSMMKGGQLMAEALGEAGDTFGYLHACMFSAERHLRENGWLKPDACDCQAPPTHMSNDCPIHGLDDGRPF
ncbi:hypothetical protein PX699_13535 [Sphingobium sp. H39-3-25]|uniref:hypothetical protein n=1 Tax=Sphingobium arseniciresistens TaxID=3030834 RepID=UPI0023B93555|nr:hypothetical protein [Sphingobium arseniciresistens]